MSMKWIQIFVNLHAVVLLANLCVIQSLTIKMSNQFITNKMCPFAQKAWIALEASSTPYTLKEVSLYGSGGKPSWFMKLNPDGTVPVLVSSDEEDVYPDSELILDHIIKVSDLHSQHENVDEIKVQSWRRNISQQIIPIGKRAVLGGSKSDLYDLLEKLDDDVIGPFLCGKSISIADCAAFPFLWRINDEFGLDNNSKLKKWLNLCSETDCFKKTVQKSWWWWW